jgi:hypothetical protein
MTNWKGMQVIHRVEGKKVGARPVGVYPRYLAGGSFHADLSKEGRSRRVFKGCGATPQK